MTALPTPLVDVFLPTHRRPRTLPFSIASGLAQSVPGVLVHVLGDGAPPETGDVVRAAGDARVTYRAFPKSCVVLAEVINRALAATSAPFVAYLTDDDLWLADHLELALAELERGGALLVATRPAHVLPDGRVDAFPFAFDLLPPPLSHRFVGLESVVHRRELLSRIGLWDESRPHHRDNDFYRRALRAGLGGFLDVPTVLRFHARHWDARYGAEPEPPQAASLGKARDPAFAAALRQEARHGRRPPGTRVRQLTDLARTAVASLPKLRRNLRASLR